MSQTLQRLVLVRHGESEGDARRNAWRRGEIVTTTKIPELEGLTHTGFQQAHLAGQWIQEHIIGPYGVIAFDGCYVSSALRSEQSAGALGLTVAVWQEDNCLDERNRGNVRGLRPAQHQETYPSSFEQMHHDPLHWLPPEGESLIPGVINRVRQFMTNIAGTETVIAVTHRDWMWAAQLVIEHLSEAELLAINTDELHNAQIVEYTSIDPITGKQAAALMWKRSVDPTATTSPSEWQILPHVAEACALV